MIKIIKNGRDPSHEIYVTTCDECGCEFIFSESDTEKEFFDPDFDDIYCYIYSIKCPCCGETCLMDNLEKYRGKRGKINE